MSISDSLWELHRLGLSFDVSLDPEMFWLNIEVWMPATKCNKGLALKRRVDLTQGQRSERMELVAQCLRQLVVDIKELSPQGRKQASKESENASCNYDSV